MTLADLASDWSVLWVEGAVGGVLSNAEQCRRNMETAIALQSFPKLEHTVYDFTCRDGILICIRCYGTTLSMNAYFISI